MYTLPVSAARENLAGAVERAQSEPVAIERYGKPAAILVSPAFYERLLEAWEEAEDLSLFDAAMAEEGPNVPWDEVKAELGWT